MTHYLEERDYAKPSPSDPFVNNLSDANLFFPDGRIETAGKHLDLATWQKESGRDEHSLVVNPLDPNAKLPDWVEAKRALWSQKMKDRGEVDALNLGLMDSPSGAECRARFFRSPDAQRVKLADTGVQAWLLTVDGQRTLAVWTTNVAERRPVRLRVGAGMVTFENPFGVQTRRTLANGAIAFTATYLPRYVRGVGTQIVEAPLGAIQAQGFNAPGQPVPVTATFTNETRESQRVQATFEAGTGYKPVPASVARTLAPGQTIQVPIALQPTGTFGHGNNSVRMTAELAGERLARSAIFSVGEGGGTLVRAAKPITIDGNLDDWKALGNAALLGTVADASQFATGDKTKWSGPNDLGAKLFGAWTPDAFYIGVQVTDDNVLPAAPGTAPWGADAIELFLDARDPALQYNTEPTPGVFQIGVSPASPPVTQVLAKSNLEGLQAATARTLGGYNVEMKIPLSATNFPAGGFTPGRPIRLSLLLDDKDDANAERDNVFGWSFSPNGANFGDASGWKTLVLGR